MSLEYVYLELMASSATESGSSAKGILHPIWKLIALHLSWLHKGMMLWIKSHTKVNTVFKKSKVLICCFVWFVLGVFLHKFLNMKENQKNKKWLYKSMKNSNREKKKIFDELCRTFLRVQEHGHYYSSQNLSSVTVSSNGMSHMSLPAGRESYQFV